MKFTDEQNIVLSLDEGSHLVIAPAGSGKTELLCCRIEKALNNGVSYIDMVCLTFTNKAARNMLNRLSLEPNSKPFVGNFHSWCVEQLLENNLLAGNVGFIDEDDQENLLLDIKEYQEIYRYVYPGLMLSFCYNKKLESIGLEDYLLPKINDNIIICIDKIVRSSLNKRDTFEIYDKLQLICEKYEGLKSELSLMDYNDIVLKTFLEIKKGNLRKRYSWIEVDESQDLNKLQWDILNLIKGHKAHTVIFADLEQSIFSFLGANESNLIEIKSKLPLNNFHFLSANFRSPKYIIDLLNNYASNNLGNSWLNLPYSSKDIERTKGDLVFLGTELERLNDFNVKLVDRVITPILSKNPSEVIAVICRTNKECNNFHRIISKKLEKTDYEIVNLSNVDFFKRNDIKLFFAIIELNYNPFDLISLTRLLYHLKFEYTLSECRNISKKIIDLGLDLSNESDIVEEVNYALVNDRIVVFDTETTGLDFQSDNIVQIAAQEIVNGIPGATFEVYIKSDKPVGTSYEIHKISDEYLIESGIEASEAIKLFKDFSKGALLIAHNSDFDKFFINQYCERKFIDFSIDYVIDSINLTKILHNDLPSYKLEYLLKILNVEGVNSHNALDDVKATVNLILKLSECIDNLLKNRIEQESFIKKFYSKKRVSILTMSMSLFDMNSEYSISKMIDIVLDEEIYPDKYSSLLHKLKNYCNENYSTYDKFKSLYHTSFQELKKHKESDLLKAENVIITSVHKSKGLEFDTVIIPNCNDQNFPFYYSIKEGKIDEEARLLYVALSRAKKRLVVGFNTKEKSRFLKNISPKYYDYFLLN